MFIIIIQKTTNFCILLFCRQCLSALAIFSWTWWRLLNKELYCLQIGIIDFLLSYFLLSNYYSQILDHYISSKTSENEYPASFLILGEILSNSPIHNIGNRFVIGRFCDGELCSSYSQFLQDFKTEGMSDFVKGLPIDMIMWLLSLSLFIWWTIFIDLHMLNHPRNLEMKSPIAWGMVFLMYHWIQFANFTENFCVHIHQGYWLTVLLLWLYLAPLNEFGNIPFLSFLWNSLRRLS